MKTFFILCTFTTIVTNSYAFLNIEALRQSPMKSQVLGSSKLTLTQQKGNTDKTLVSFNTLARYKKEKHNYLALIDYQYGESFSEIDNRQGHLHFRYSYDISAIFEIEVFQQSQFNKFQDLNSRFLFGSGARNQLYKGKTMSLYNGVGLFYEKESLKDQINIENPRGNIYLSLLWTKEDSYSISSTFYYQPNLEVFSDNRIKFNLGLETIFENNFTQTIEYSLSRDTRPPAGITSTDSILSAGIGYKY